jgi:hypothetical protein
MLDREARIVVVVVGVTVIGIVSFLIFAIQRPWKRGENFMCL